MAMARIFHEWGYIYSAVETHKSHIIAFSIHLIKNRKGSRTSRMHSNVYGNSAKVLKIRIMTKFISITKELKPT